MAQEQVQELKSHLNLIKSMTGDKAEEQFYQLMQKAKNAFGSEDLNIAQFYFEYAKFLLQKMEKNIDIFNAGSLPVGQKGVQDNPIAQDLYEDDSSGQNQSAKSENNVNITQKQQQGKNIGNANDQPQIAEDNEQKQNKEKNEEKFQQQNDQGKLQEHDQAGEAGQQDDFIICAQNFLYAIKLFQAERDRLNNGGQQGKFDKNQIQRWISRCKSRLGDLYQLSENYTQAVATYRQVVENEQKKIGHQSNRGLAEIHYMIANSFLYDNKEGCQKIAIKQFIKSVQILLNHMALLNPNDTTTYQVPTQEKVKVDRFAYLPNGTDSEQVKQIKEVISCLLDKIEDTYEQIAIKVQYEAEKAKTKQDESANKFKQVSATTPVIQLGTFGNRKKMPSTSVPDQELKKRE